MFHSTGVSASSRPSKDSRSSWTSIHTSVAADIRYLRWERTGTFRCPGLTREIEKPSIRRAMPPARAGGIAVFLILLGQMIDRTASGVTVCHPHRCSQKGHDGI
jgi:hypothetical protein